MALVKAETRIVIYSKPLQSVVAVDCPDSSHFLGAFTKLRKASTNFVMYVCPSVCSFIRMEKLGSHLMGFSCSFNFGYFFKKSVKIKVSFKKDKNNG